MRDVIVTTNSVAGILIRRGNLQVENNFVRAFINELAVILRSGIASGNHVAAHIIVNKYLVPLFIFGNRLTQSMITLEKGAPVTGAGCKGGIGIDSKPENCQVII